MHSALLTTSAGQSVGYIFSNPAFGAFDPSGRVTASPEQVKAHNAALESAEIDAAKQSGRAIFYFSKSNDGRDVVQQWAGALVAYPVSIRKSRHNMAGRDGRTDVWFYLAGARWHGVNIGDNQILRSRRVRS